MRFVLWILAGLVLWAGAAVVTVLDARSGVEQAEATLRSMLEEDDPLALDGDELVADLESAAADLQAARDALGGAHLRPLGILPVVGRQLESATSMIEVADDVVDHAIPVAGALDAEPGAEPLDVMQTLDRDLQALLATVEGRDLGPSDALIGRLADGRAELDAELGEFETTLHDAAAGVHAFRSLLEGSEYLVLGGNNAEMMAGTGMHLSVGQLVVTDGQADLREFESSESRFPVLGVQPVSSEFDANWGFLSPTNDYRKLGYSANFAEVVAPQALAMWEAERGRPLDGVMALDPLVFRALLNVVGPVELDGEQFDAASILDYLVFDQYVAFDGVDRELRRDRLGDLAEAVSLALAERTWDPVELLRELRPLVELGHVRLYDTDPLVQEGWTALGASGALDGNDLGVFLTNLGASKLDPFISVAVEVSAERVNGGVDVRYDIELQNNVIPGLPSYVVGPWEPIGLAEEGTYLGRLVLYLPGGATEDRFRLSRSLEVSGPEAGLNVRALRLELAPGETERLTFEYRLPALDTIDLIPTARWPRTAWTWNGTPVDEGANVAIGADG